MLGYRAQVIAILRFWQSLKMGGLPQGLYGDVGQRHGRGDVYTNEKILEHAASYT